MGECAVGGFVLCVCGTIGGVSVQQLALCCDCLGQLRDECAAGCFLLCLGHLG